MSLRAKLALTLASLAAVCVVAVTLIGYTSTSRDLRDEIDRSLLAYTPRLSAPDGRAAAALCNKAAPPFPDGGAGGSGPSIPGVRVQCLDADGEPVTHGGEGDEIVDHTDARLAASGGPTRLRTVSSDDGSYRILTVAIPGGGAVQVYRSLTETDHVLDELRNRYLFVGGAIVALAALAGWWIARRTAAPLAHLTRAAEHVTETGRLEVQVPTSGHDEAARLARAFATMIDALNRSRDQQQRLAQDAGHELRTPLTSLRTNIDTLARHPDLPGVTRSQIFADLNIEAHELTTLVDELVALVTDRAEDEPEATIALDELVTRAATRVQRHTGHPIEIHARPCTVLGRPRRILRAVTNLLDNAAKFSPDGASIEVAVADGRVTVRDHGPGVAPRDLPHLFDRFYRADAARGLPGSGLGLSIVQVVAAEHGGTVTIDNAPGGGAIATLALPTNAGTGSPPGG